MSLDRICRHCHRPIKWCRTEANGRMMPLDPEPNEDGNVFCEFDAGTLIGRVKLKGDARPPGVAHMAHFATCPVRRKRKSPKTPKPKPEPAPSLFDTQGEPNERSMADPGPQRSG